MSLINDALKKAQKQRTGEAPPLASMPSIGGEPAAKIAKRAKPAGFNALLLRLGFGAGGLLVLAIGGYFLLRPKSENRAPRTEDSPKVVAATPAATKPEPSPLPAEAKPSAGQTPGSQQGTTVPTLASPKPSDVGGFTLPIAVPSKPEPEAAPVVVPPAPKVVKETKPSPAPTASPGKFDNKAIDYVENLHIAGIRASATDSKVLMNDRVYRIGDMVDRDLGLKLVGITSGSLTFENESGARYTRTF